jgi:ketosteroid isomerase-like protein
VASSIIPTMSNKDLIHQFYTAFTNADWQKMADCYHDEIEFEDPAFGELTGNRAKWMWKMLLERAKGNLKIEHEVLDEKHAKWIAHYPFGPKKRPIVNKIEASFEFQDGKIIKHKDHFSLWLWARQAFGLTGWIMGATPLFRKGLQQRTNQQLDRYIQKQKLEI